MLPSQVSVLGMGSRELGMSREADIENRWKESGPCTPILPWARLSSLAQDSGVILLKETSLTHAAGQGS